MDTTENALTNCPMIGIHIMQTTETLFSADQKDDMDECAGFNKMVVGKQRPDVVQETHTLLMSMRTLSEHPRCACAFLASQSAWWQQRKDDPDANQKTT